MKNNKLKISTMLIALFLCFSAQGQEAVLVEGYRADLFGRQKQDLSKLPKMQRDIEILKNVLKTQFVGESRGWSRNEVNGIYIEGQGVLFNVTSSQNEIIFASNLPQDNRKIDDQSFEKANQEKTRSLKEKSTDFIVNYASLLSELKNGEIVMLNVEYNLSEMDSIQSANIYGTAAQGLTISSTGQSKVVVRGIRRSQQMRMISTITKESLDAYATGRLTYDGSDPEVPEIDRIIKSIDQEEMKDVKIFAGILDDLFSTSQENALRRRNKTSYSYFEGFGLMFNMKFRTTSGSVTYIEVVDGENVISQDVRGDQSKQREEYYAQLEEDFPAFEKRLKEIFLEYGRTLRSVQSDEVIIVNIDLGSVPSKAKIPRNLQMIIPKSTINDYATGKLSLEKAADNIDIKKLMTAVSSNTPMVYEELAIQEAISPARTVNGWN